VLGHASSHCGDSEKWPDCVVSGWKFFMAVAAGISLCSKRGTTELEVEWVHIEVSGL
jgi:hypothetical protein